GFSTSSSTSLTLPPSFPPRRSSDLPGAIHWTRLPSPATVADQAVAFHHSLTRLVDVPLERRLRDARALYEMIIRPIEPWLSGARSEERRVGKGWRWGWWWCACLSKG